MMQESRYYGVAWNYIEDTYRTTGLLVDVKNYEDAKEKMFIHNSIEKTPAGTYKIPKVYYRHRVIETEIVMDMHLGLLCGLYDFVEGYKCDECGEEDVLRLCNGKALCDDCIEKEYAKAK